MRLLKFTPLAVVLLFFLWGVLSKSLQFNLVALEGLSILFGKGKDSTRIPENLSSLGETHCQAYWYEGFLDQQNGRGSPSDNAWAQAIQCNASLILYLHTLLPEKADWAVYATRTQPESAEAWFWLGDLQPENRLEYYQKGLQFDPTDGRRWIAVGDMLQNIIPQAAIEAYLQGCYNGDPGFNGCVRAGGIAERQGLFEEAIQYYRLSQWEGSQTRADRLEQQLQLTPQK